MCPVCFVTYVSSCSMVLDKYRKPLSRISFVIIVLAVALTSFGLHVLNRFAYHVPSLPTKLDTAHAANLFWVTVVLGFLLPLGLYLLTNDSRNYRRWSFSPFTLVLLALFCGSVLLYTLPFIALRTIELFARFFPDLNFDWEIVILCAIFMAAYLGYSFTINRAIFDLRTKYWTNGLMNFIGGVMTGFVTYSAAWMMVYFE